MLIASLIIRCELTSGAAWTKLFGLPEIVMLKELHQRAPVLLKNTIMSVDVMADASEQVLSVLFTCFSGGAIIHELGLGEAEVGDRLQILLYALAIISTTVAILYTAEGCEIALGAALGPESRGESEGESRDEMMNGTWGGEGEDAADRDAVAGEGGAVAGGDGVGAVVSTIAADRGAVAGMTWWATCLMGAHQIVDQIYKYRLRTERYDVIAPQGFVDEGLTELTPKQRSSAARLEFVNTVGEIYKNAIATEVSKGSALEMSATSRLQPHQDDTEKAAFQHMLQRHVDLRLLTRAPTMAPLAPKKWLRQNKVHAIDMDGDGKISAAELKAAKAATKAGMEVMAKILPHELPALYDDFTSE
ncbi:hypothetical protein Ctob_010612, partial [Chrysochromulina tobinii]